MEATSTWRSSLIDDNNFSQKVPYDIDKLIKNFENVCTNLNEIQPFEFLSAVYEFTKAFNRLSSALGMGFSDITEKVQTWRDIFKNEYKDQNFTNMQAVMLDEIKKNIHQCNGENNSKLGYKKSTTYYKYVSGCRTMVRFSWFLKFIHNTLKNMNDTELPFSTCIKNAYNDALAPHHGFMVKTAVKAAFAFASSKRGPALKAFFGDENLTEEVQAKLTNLIDLLNRIYEAIHNFLKDNTLLDLP